MSQNKRVVITGMGALSPIGNDVRKNNMGECSKRRKMVWINYTYRY